MYVFIYIGHRISLQCFSSHSVYIAAAQSINNLCMFFALSPNRVRKCGSKICMMQFTHATVTHSLLNFQYKFISNILNNINECSLCNIVQTIIYHTRVCLFRATVFSEWLYFGVAGFPI